ncbi:MAG: PAS domain S-box protein [Myxococcota bacterium]|nr:PAS domain S-box protein [Myxococcota bacterium]
MFDDDHEPRAIGSAARALVARVPASAARLSSHPRARALIDVPADGELEREQMRLAIEQCADAILITDAEGTIEYVNAAFERVTGYARSEVIGANPRILNSGCQDRGFYGRMWATLKTGAAWRGELVNRRKDGSRFTEDVTISPIRDRTGTVVSYVSAKRDITAELELRTRLRQVERMNTVGMLAGGIAHDLNNLLGVVALYTGTALEACSPSSTIADDLEQVRAAVDRATALVRLLASSRPEPPRPGVVEVNTAVAATLRLMARLLGDRIDVSSDFGDGVWPVCIDRAQLDQIVTNLLINARDAIDGTGRITVRTTNARPGEVGGATPDEASTRSYVTISITDDGCGMDAHTIRNIFEPFFSTKRERGGTGLGLSVVHSIVEQNGGFVRVASERGVGTTFEISLPRYEPKSAPSEPPVRSARSIG